MKRVYRYISLCLLMFIGVSSCEVTDFEHQENPNFLTPEGADPTYLLNEMQYLFQHYMSWMILNTDDVMRYEGMTDRYGDVVSSNVMDGSASAEWDTFYEALNNARTIQELAVEDSIYLFHSAMSRVLMGYLTVTMVDYVGEIPYSEAVKPSEFPDPNVDEGEELYKFVLSEIEKAKSEFENAPRAVTSDLFYGGDKDKWISMANSLRLRMLVQSRLASDELVISDLQGEINSLLTDEFIDSNSEDFQFSYSNVIQPESRHPYFQRAYVSGFSQYLGNYFMDQLLNDKSVRDPRTRFYIYRQSDVDPFSGPPYLPCQDDPRVDYCYLGDQYWGYDHGENRTGRGDNLLRSVYGIYPGGGAFDQNQFIAAPNTTNNLGGAGILPILTNSYLKFLTAESALMLGTNGDPAALLEEGVRASLNKVVNFGDISSEYTPDSEDIDIYVEDVLTKYNSANSDQEKLDVIMKEYYLAAFGNSIEAYNAYRRTGLPSDLQVPIDDDDPNFPRSFPYSELETQRNASLTQKQISEKVFWDTNPDGFIK